MIPVQQTHGRPELGIRTVGGLHEQLGLYVGERDVRLSRGLVSAQENTGC